MKLTEHLQSVELQAKNMRTYWVLAVLRVFLVLMPQSGYIHPDEFFQSLEVMAGKCSELWFLFGIRLIFMF